MSKKLANTFHACGTNGTAQCIRSKNNDGGMPRSAMMLVQGHLLRHGSRGFKDAPRTWRHKLAPNRQLIEYLTRYEPAITSLTLGLRAMVLEEAPEARELVHAGYAVAVAFTFTGRLGGAFCYIAAYRKHVNLGLNHGAALPDPHKVLVGTGKQMRHIRIATEQDLSLPYLTTFIRAAIEKAAR